MKHLEEFEHINEYFYFDNFDDTDISGSNMEIAIDQMIEDAKTALIKIIPEDKSLRNDARIAIKKLWKEKIDNWKE